MFEAHKCWYILWKNLNTLNNSFFKLVELKTFCMCNWKSVERKMSFYFVSLVSLCIVRFCYIVNNNLILQTLKHVSFTWHFPIWIKWSVWLMTAGLEADIPDVLCTTFTQQQRRENWKWACMTTQILAGWHKACTVVPKIF